VVLTPSSQRAAPSPAWRWGTEEYHITKTTDGRYDVRGTIRTAAVAFAARAQQRDDAELAALCVDILAWPVIN
jgi:hypothetical protein